MDASDRPLIIVVNDDTAFLQLMEQLLEDEGYEAEVMKSTKNALEHIKERRPALIVLDVRINNEQAGLLLLDLITLDPETRSIPVVIASANLQALAGREDELASKGIYVIAKPFDIDDLAALIRKALWRAEPARRTG
ncbi:MAG TPA: response regulator [Candidatus Limnocylindria bacterium]